jgi:hypothetical protein
MRVDATQRQLQGGCYRSRDHLGTRWQASVPREVSPTAGMTRALALIIRARLSCGRSIRRLIRPRRRIVCPSRARNAAHVAYSSRWNLVPAITGSHEPRPM